MSVGAVDETADGGLDSFDEDAAAENLASVGDDVRERVAEAEAAPEAAAPAEAAPQPTAAPEEGAFPAVPQFDPIGPPPPPPELSPDPAENTRRMVEWQRQLVDHHNQVTNRQVALNEFTAKVAAARGGQEARVAAAKAEAVKRENAQAAERRARAQAAIDSAVQERIQSKRDLEAFKWEQPHDGRTIAALIFGAIGAALQNTAGVQSGRGGDHENEAAVAINAKMKRDYEAKKAKYAAAGDALLMAKYGVKTAEDAHRAAMNDLNADFAARYKLIADQAESVLKQQGVPAEQAKGNALVTNALQEAAKQEAQIHDREEAHRIQRENNAATQAMARAHLSLSQAQLAATLGDKRLNRERKEDDEIVKGDKGEAIGRVPGGKGGAQAFATRDADYHRAQKTLEALIADVEKNGPRVISPSKVKERNTLYNNAVIGVATVSPLGKTNEAQELEAASIGSSGAAGLNAGVVAGANLEALKRKLEEIKGQRQQYRTQTLNPLTPEEEGRFNAKAAPTKTPPVDDALKAKIDRAWKAMEDPKQPKAERQGARRFLQDQGQL